MRELVPFGATDSFLLTCIAHARAPHMSATTPQMAGGRRDTRGSLRCGVRKVGVADAALGWRRLQDLILLDEPCSTECTTECTTVDSLHAFPGRCAPQSRRRFGLAQSRQLRPHRVRMRERALDVPARSCGGLNDVLQFLVSAGQALLGPSEALLRGMPILSRAGEGRMFGTRIRGGFGADSGWIRGRFFRAALVQRIEIRGGFGADSGRIRGEFGGLGVWCAWGQSERGRESGRPRLLSPGIADLLGDLGGDA